MSAGREPQPRHITCDCGPGIPRKNRSINQRETIDDERNFAAVAILLGLFGPACADDMPMPAGAKGSADAAFMQSMDAMNKAMNAPMTGDPDKDFVTMMLPHHTGAVAMAKIELRYGKDPVLRAMARDIIASQDKEIATMQQWRRKHAR